MAADPAWHISSPTETQLISSVLGLAWHCVTGVTPFGVQTTFVLLNRRGLLSSESEIG